MLKYITAPFLDDEIPILTTNYLTTQMQVLWPLKFAKDALKNQCAGEKIEQCFVSQKNKLKNIRML